MVSADTVKGVVRLTAPEYVDPAQAIRFARSKATWLARQFADAPAAVAIVNGAQISLCGSPYVIRWLPDHSRKPNIIAEREEIQLGGPEDNIEPRLLRWLQEQARHYMHEDLVEYCAKAALPLPRLSIGDAKRRWGSCSNKQAIRLNWRLVMAPSLVRRSVVAHEVAHLKHMDHSRRFYAFLDDIFEGDRRKADMWLKQHGRGLHMIGAQAATAK